MADSKQYIVLKQERGTVLISEDVITTIIENAVKDVVGVVGLSTKPESDIAEKVGRKGWSKGIRITVTEDNTLSVDCNINILYGQSVVSIAEAVQNAISSALESVTAVNTATINVNVCGIVRQ